MKEIKLKKQNRSKYCIDCRKIVVIRLEGKEGFCPDCGKKLFTLDTRSERFR